MHFGKSEETTNTRREFSFMSDFIKHAFKFSLMIIIKKLNGREQKLVFVVESREMDLKIIRSLSPAGTSVIAGTRQTELLVS